LSVTGHLSAIRLIEDETMKSYVLLNCLLLISTIAFADTLVVPDQYASINQAIAAASNGDTVLVKPGRYSETIDFNGKAIAVRSSAGRHLTVIDGGQSGRVVTFAQGEQAGSVLEGFTITNGIGGICCLNGSSPTITGNTISGNSAQDGGAIDCVSSSPAVLSNVITGNTSFANGGGIHCTSSDPLIASNVIADNTAGGSGGGIHCGGCSPDIVNNTIVHNTADLGGGIHAFNCGSAITNSIIRDNSADPGPDIHLEGAGTIAVNFCNILGGWQGTGNIDIDPIFVKETDGDYHLVAHSPCRDAGNASTVPPGALDFEGDPRIAGGSVDIGADEFNFHLYHVGDLVPGGAITIKVMGLPRQPVRLCTGSSIQDPPLQTTYGELWLTLPLLSSWSIGTISRSGVLVYKAVVPTAWTPGDVHHFQALVGPFGGSATGLTNLLELGVN
jgi:parallel beta-helix repeat protein/predicted outer membrane repeat protein